MRAKELEGKGRQDDAGMDKIACVLLGDLRQIAWIIRTCKRVLKCLLKIAAFVSQDKPAVQRGEMRLREGLEDACNRACYSRE
jgi:hypothetical protein